MSRKVPPAQLHQRLVAIHFELTDGSALHHAVGRTTTVGPVPRLAAGLRQVLNSAYALRGYAPPFPDGDRALNIEVVLLTVVLIDDRALIGRRTVVRFVLATDGRSVVKLDCSSEPGGIYMYVYGHDLAEITREVIQQVLSSLVEPG